MKTTSTRRPAFTLVEMLVVILIMSILVSLVTLGVTRAMRFASEVGTKTEMAQIEQALGAAALDLGRVPYMPSYIVLKKRPSQYDMTNQWHTMSRRLLQTMFPNWDGSVDAGWPDTTLNATQAYVFFLGGMNGTEGFNAKDPNPTLSGGKRKGPYFNFKPDRLVPDSTKPGICSFKDYWNNDTYLAVYSSQMVASGTLPPNETPTNYPGRQTSKANTLYMPKGYQIFAAGKDGKWGASGGGAGQYGQAAFNGLLTNDGEDDQCNFSESPLGKPIND
jgi:prepilin-type N-terminal cleavage/methylation domain-containing protein